MNNLFEPSFNLIGQFQNKMLKLKNNVEAAEKKKLDYEMELFNKNKDIEYLNKATQDYKLKIRELELNVYELEFELELKEEKNGIKKKPKIKTQWDTSLYITNVNQAKNKI